MAKKKENKVGTKFRFSVMRCGAQVAAEKGIRIDPERISTDVIMEANAVTALKLLMEVLTQEEACVDYPADWWQAIKERWFPTWLRRRSPVRFKRVWMIHKYPELNTPTSPVGREFVHARIVEWDEFQKELVERQEHKKAQ